MENTESAESTPAEDVRRSDFSAASPLRLLWRKGGVRQGRRFPVAGYTAAAGGGVPGKQHQQPRVRPDADWAETVVDKAFTPNQRLSDAILFPHASPPRLR